MRCVIVPFLIDLQDCIENPENFETKIGTILNEQQEFVDELTEF